jgi:hypothetical protein
LPREDAVGVSAYVVALDNIVAAKQSYAVALETIDDQARDGAAIGRDIQAIGQAIGPHAGTRTVQLDQGLTLEPRLRAAIDDNGIDNRRQRTEAAAAHVDRLCPGVDLEAYSVQPRVAVGIEDCLPQRTGAVVGGVQDGECRQQGPIFQRL